MATYHICDICVEEMPQDEKRQCFIQIGSKKTYRQINPDYDGLPYINIECCPSCAKKVEKNIEALNTRTERSDTHE